MKIVKSILFQDKLTETINEGTPVEEVIELIPEQRVIIYYIDDQEILPPNEKDFTMLSKLIKLNNLDTSNTNNYDISTIGNKELMNQLLINLENFLQYE